MKPLAIDLCCGKGKHFPDYPGDYFIKQDVRTLDGKQFAGATLIVASSPCEEFSYRALPWGKNEPPPELGIELFRACERIGKESAAPYVLENVAGARKYVGPSVNHLGPFHLWGTAVPAVFPPELYRVRKGINFDWDPATRTRRYDGQSGGRLFSSGSEARRQWSATVAMIPEALAAAVGEMYHRPETTRSA